MNRNTKIVIWGYPEHSHTHSYIHLGFYRAFKYLGFDVYWFDDDNYPTSFNFSNCIFLTEGFADRNIPLNKTSIYFVAYCPDPNKYLLAEVKDFIEIRTACVQLNDHIYNFRLNKQSLNQIGPSMYLEDNNRNFIEVRNNYVHYLTKDYKKLYMFWATHLMPEEINLKDMYLKRTNKIYFHGTLSSKGVNENLSVWKPLIKSLKQNGIEFIHSDPWKTPVSNQKLEYESKESLLGIDLRGPAHLKEGYVGCRLMKLMSFGHLGLSNSYHAFEEMGGNIIYNNSPTELLNLGLEHISNFKLIKDGMLYVKENHTFINRVNDMLSIL